MKQTEILTHATHVNGWEPAVYMSCMSQNFRLFHVSNLSVRNFRIFLLMYTGSLASRMPTGPERRTGDARPSIAQFTDIKRVIAGAAGAEGVTRGSPRVPVTCLALWEAPRALGGPDRRSASVSSRGQLLGEREEVPAQERTSALFSDRRYRRHGPLPLVSVCLSVPQPYP